MEERESVQQTALIHQWILLVWGQRLRRILVSVLPIVVFSQMGQMSSIPTYETEVQENVKKTLNQPMTQKT